MLFDDWWVAKNLRENFLILFQVQVGYGVYNAGVGCGSVEKLTNPQLWGKKQNIRLWSFPHSFVLILLLC